MTDKATEDILKSAILLEKRGRAFYKKIAKQTEYPAVKEFFNMMAAEEETHVAMLTEQWKSYQESGHFKSTSYGEDDTFTGVATKVLSDKLKTEISAADFEAAAIGAAMSMEQGAIEALVRIDAVATHALSSFNLDFVGLKVEAIQVEILVDQKIFLLRATCCRYDFAGSVTEKV